MNALALSVLLQLSAVSATPDSYDAAYADAVKNDRPLVVLVGADWCAACQTMKSSVIPELQRSGDFKQVSFATVNSDSQSELAKQLSPSTSIPQLVMYRKTSTGWLRSTLSGAQSSGTVRTFLNRARPGYSNPVVHNVARPISSYSP